MFLGTAPAFAANEPEPHESSGAALLLIFLPAGILMGFMFVALRSARRNRSMVEKEFERSEEHRRLTAEHMKRVEDQIDVLNNRLGQVVQILSAIEQGQRSGRG